MKPAASTGRPPPSPSGEALAASTPAQPRFVAGSMGPTTKTISVTGGVTFDELAESYHQQAAGLLEGGADVLLLETGQDTLNIKAGLEGIDRAFAELGRTAPVAVQGTVEPMGTLLAGQDVEALYTSLAHRDLLWMGLNCATGPQFMTDHIRSLAPSPAFRWPPSPTPECPTKTDATTKRRRAWPTSWGGSSRPAG